MFSPRQQEILHLLADYYSYAEIAVKLGMRINTVYNHVYVISLKTGIHTHIKLIAYAQANGYGRKGVNL